MDWILYLPLHVFPDKYLSLAHEVHAFGLLATEQVAHDRSHSDRGRGYINMTFRYTKETSPERVNAKPHECLPNTVIVMVATTTHFQMSDAADHTPPSPSTIRTK